MSKVLVIDDEKPTLGMFRLILSACGHNVLTAENGSEGLELYRREKPPIVLTDIKMPGMDGLEVLEEIKGIDPDTEVIVITGHGDMDLAVKALNLSATDFVNKPIQKFKLDSALKRAEERLKSAKEQVNKVSLRTVNDVTIMDIEGNVTSVSEPLLLDAYKEASEKGATKIVLRFNEHSSINGAGLAVLIQLLSESKKRNQAVTITGLSENFKKIFEMVGITGFATIFNHEEDAVSSFAQNG
ncbi:MAG: response regulator [Deltaproteobacteria bacterium]|nr:MAG: response regulator [Deltaproteobacteria bacterium]